MFECMDMYMYACIYICVREGVTVCLVHLATSRCFSFGIGSGASTHLVKGIAQAGLGTSEFITSGERMQPKVCACMQSWSALFSGS